MRYALSLVFVFCWLGALGCDTGAKPSATMEAEPSDVTLTADDFMKNAAHPEIFLLQLQAKGAIPEADVNHDGVVDISDLVIVAKNFGLEVVVDEPLPGLPANTAGYERWLRLNQDPIPPKPADPHNGTKNVYANQNRAVLAPDGRQAFPYPNGTVVVKEITHPGGDFVSVVAVMWKAKGSDPAHNDWTFVEYIRGAANEPFRVLAKDATCWGCHATAAGTDYVFTRLE
jgi:hypothetical protein